jgi:hypothetical protein
VLLHGPACERLKGPGDHNVQILFGCP